MHSKSPRAAFRHRLLTVGLVALSPVISASDDAAPDAYLRGQWLASAVVGQFDPLDSDRDIELRETRVGVGYYFLDRLAVIGEAHILDARGQTLLADGPHDGSASGLGVALLLRWHFLARHRWTAFVDLGWGLVATDEAFPAGGTEVNGTSQYGLGLTFRANDHFDLLVSARQLHLSNGRGLVDDNPSYDGTGFQLGGIWRFGRPATRAQGPRIPWTSTGASRWTPRLEVQAGDVDGESYRGGEGTFDIPFGERWAGQSSVAVADLADETFVRASLSAYRRGPKGTTALTMEREELDVFSTDRLTVQQEVILGDRATVVGVVGRERRSHDPDRWLGALRFRVYPIPNLLIEPGLSFVEPASGSFDFDDLQTTLDLEYQPSKLARFGLSIFVHDRVDELLLVGLRFTPKRPGTLWQRHHRQALYRTRF